MPNHPRPSNDELKVIRKLQKNFLEARQPGTPWVKQMMATFQLSRRHAFRLSAAHRYNAAGFVDVPEPHNKGQVGIVRQITQEVVQNYEWGAATGDVAAAVQEICDERHIAVEVKHEAVRRSLRLAGETLKKPSLVKMVGDDETNERRSAVATNVVAAINEAGPDTAIVFMDECQCQRGRIRSLMEVWTPKAVRAYVPYADHPRTETLSTSLYVSDSFLQRLNCRW